MHFVAYILLVIGGLNWLLYGVMGTDVGSWIGGMDSIQARIIYILVGIAAIVSLFTHKKECKKCDTGSMAPKM